MKNGKVKITKWAYLKMPLYSWTFHNESGGSFSNSGMHRSFNRCAEHARSMCGIDCKIETFIYDGENEVKSPEMSNC